MKHSDRLSEKQTLTTFNLKFSTKWKATKITRMRHTYFAAGKAKIFEALHNHLLSFARRECACDAAINSKLRQLTLNPIIPTGPSPFHLASLKTVLQ